MFAAIEVAAQQSSAADASSRGTAADKDDSPSRGMLETQYRWRIRAEEREHTEMVERSADVLRLGETLKSAFETNQSFAQADAAKLQQLEKQIKKIRRALGGDDDEAASENRPASVADALDRLIEVSQNLNKELKENSRHEISASSIENANELLELIKFIRGVRGS